MARRPGRRRRRGSNLAGLTGKHRNAAGEDADCPAPGGRQVESNTEPPSRGRCNAIRWHRTKCGVLYIEIFHLIIKIACMISMI